jgi:hypothetical protein
MLRTGSLLAAAAPAAVVLPSWHPARRYSAQLEGSDATSSAQDRIHQLLTARFRVSLSRPRALAVRHRCAQYIPAPEARLLARALLSMLKMFPVRGVQCSLCAV